MRFIKSTIATMLALVVFLFSGCIFLQKPKTFQKAGASITLTNAFVEKEYVSMTCYYESPEMIVTMLKEEFSLLDGLEDWTLVEYGRATIAANKLSDCDVFTSEDGYVYFRYYKEISGNNYSYYATCHKSGDAFWLIQFACLSKNFDKLFESMRNYAKTITFEASTDTPNV